MNASNNFYVEHQIVEDLFGEEDFFVGVGQGGVAVDVDRGLLGVSGVDAEGFENEFLQFPVVHFSDVAPDVQHRSLAGFSPSMTKVPSTPWRA